MEVCSSKKKILELLNVKHIFVLKYNLMGFFSRKRNTEVPKGHVDLLSDFQGVPLRNFLNVYLGEKVRNLPKGKLIKVSDLSGDWINYELKTEKLEVVELYSPHIKQLYQSCLLISNYGAQLTVSYFSFTGEPIFCSPHIHCFSVQTGEIEIGYLILQLLKTKEVSNQVKFLLGDNFIGRINIEDVLDIRIFPGESESKSQIAQNSYAENIRADYKGFFETSSTKVNLIKDSSNREIASLRHTSTQYLSALLSSVQGVKKFLEKEGGKEISLNSIYSQSQNLTLEDHLKSSEKLILSITDMLLNNSIEAAQSVPIDLLKIIKEAQSFYSNRNFYFMELEIDNVSFGKNASISELFILFDGNSFLKLFSNIVSNAIGHGFKGRGDGNVVRTLIYFDDDENKCVLEISNNGLPLAEDFDFKRLVTWGEKTSDSEGKGIGGADIWKIMENHNGSFEVINSPMDEFPVTYKLGFKIYADIL